MTATTLTESLDAFCDLVARLGVTDDVGGPGMFAVDFSNVIVADNYLVGTGYLPDRQTAEGIAATFLPVLDALSFAIATATGQEYDATANRIDHDEPPSYATIVSWDREPWGDDPRGGDPVVEEMHFGDAWYVASIEMGDPFISPEQATTLAKVRTVLTAAQAAS